MRGRVVIALLVLTVTGVLAPMAFASPPDQSWLGGFFDDADYDDVVLLITGASPAATPTVTSDAKPSQIVVASVVDAADEFVPGLELFRQNTRAPPVL